MEDSAERLLLLARHAEPTPDGSGLTARGVAQAEHLGRRLADLPLDRVVHGPLPRATQTARIVADASARPLDRVCEDAAGDYVPSVPRADEVPDAWADSILPEFADVSEDEARGGAMLADRAIGLLAGPAVGGRGPLEVVVTHAFTIGWLVRHALGAPHWRWWRLDPAHAGLTMIRYAEGRPPTLVVLNDLSHLPADLRWTGFPAGPRP